MTNQTLKKWQEVKFKDFVKLQRGFDLPKQDRIEGEYPVIASTSITGYHDEYKVEPPCVTTGRSGALGEVLYIRSKCWPLNTVLWVKDFKGNDPYFVYSKLKTLHLEQYNSGAGVPTLNRNHLDQILIDLPSVEDQKEISSVLSTYDNLIENNSRRIKILEQMAQTTYTEWFVSFRFPNHEKAKMVDSGTDFGKIPEGWEMVKIGQLLAKIHRKTKVKRGNYVNTGEFPIIDQGKDFIGGYTSDKNCVYQEFPAIVFGDHTRILKYINFPFACGADGTQLLYSNDLERMPMTLFFYSIQNVDLSNFHYARHFKFLKDKIVLLPDQKMASLFNEYVNPCRDAIKNLQYQNQNLRQARDLLLPKLVTGVIRV